MCRHETERKQRRLVVEDLEEQMGWVLSAYGMPLMAVSLFWYLGKNCLPLTMIGWRWNGTSREHWGNRDIWRRCWDGRDQIREQQ